MPISKIYEPSSFGRKGWETAVESQQYLLGQNYNCSKSALGTDAADRAVPYHKELIKIYIKRPIEAFVKVIITEHS